MLTENRMEYDREIEKGEFRKKRIYTNTFLVKKKVL